MDNKTMSAYAKSIYSTLLEVGSAPSGHIYAALMGKMSLDEYHQIIGVLKDIKLVKESHHVLTAVKMGEPK